MFCYHYTKVERRRGGKKRREREREGGERFITISKINNIMVNCVNRNIYMYIIIFSIENNGKALFSVGLIGKGLLGLCHI